MSIGTQPLFHLSFLGDDTMPCACHNKHNQTNCPENNTGFDMSQFVNLSNLQNCTGNCTVPCTITPGNGCRNTPCECIPIPVDSPQTEYEMCCDQNGCCKLYSKCCRNLFWPEFSHPRWLCCDLLYCMREE